MLKEHRESIDLAAVNLSLLAFVIVVLVLFVLLVFILLSGLFYPKMKLSRKHNRILKG